MIYYTTKGVGFTSDFKLEKGDYVLLQDHGNGTATLDRVLPRDYVEEWSGSASTLEVDGLSIEVVA